MNLLILFCSLLYWQASGNTFEYNATTPLPASIMSRFANLSKPRLEIPYFIEYYDASMAYVPLGSQLAIEKLSTATPYLQDFEIEVKFYDTYCNDLTLIGDLLNILEQGTTNLPYVTTYGGCAMVGQELLAEVVNYYNYTATALLDVVNIAVQNRQRFRNYFILGATIDAMNSAMLRFIAAYGWTRIALISEDTHTYYQEWNGVLLNEIKKARMDLIWYEKVPFYNDYNDADWDRVMKSLVVADPRIIIFNGDSGYAPLCWFYKYKLYGPNYAIFFIHWADSNSDQIVIPPYMKHWCTADMVRLTLNTTFTYGENGRVDVEPEIPDDVGMTYDDMEHELQTRVEDPEKIVWLHNKYSYYDSILYTGFVFNEVERMLRERGDSLINWNVGSQNFKENGGYINEVIKEAMTNIRVVGLRGIYDFFKKTSKNTGGGTPTPIYQFHTKPGSDKTERVEVYDGKIIFPGAVRWQTGSPPFDRVLLKHIDVASLTSEATIALIIVVVIIILTVLGILVFKKSTRTIENLLLFCGFLIISCHVFILPLRDVEPIALHCSVLATLFVAGISTCFVAIWLALEGELKELQTQLEQIQRNVTIINTTHRKKTKLEKMLTAILLTIFAILVILLVISEPVRSARNEATLDMTFGRRELELSTRIKCNLSMNTFSLAIMGLIVGLVVIIIIKSFVASYEIQLSKKLKKTMRSRQKQKSRSKTSEIIDSRNVFVIMVTLIIATMLLLLLVDNYAFYITAVTSVLFGLDIVFKLSLDIVRNPLRTSRNHTSSVRPVGSVQSAQSAVPSDSSLQPTVSTT